MISSHPTSAPSHIREPFSDVEVFQGLRGNTHKLAVTCGSMWPTLSDGRDVGGQYVVRVCVCVQVASSDDRKAKGHIFQATLFQSADYVWNPGSLHPSYSTQIAKANGGTTCFSSIRDAAIYNTVLKVALSLGQLFHSVIHSDIFTLHEELYNSKWPPNTARNFPVRLNIKLGSSSIRYITVKFLDSVRKVLSIFLWPSFTL